MMLATLYSYATGDQKCIEKILDEDVVNINHIVLPQGEQVPNHRANSHVHMIVVRGTLTLQLGEEQKQHFSRGNIVHVPYDTPMQVRNEHDEVLEFFVVKTPSPRVYGK